MNVKELASVIKTLNAELNSICHLLASLGAHHILHVSRIRVKEAKGFRRPESQGISKKVMFLHIKNSYPLNIF